MTQTLAPTPATCTCGAMNIQSCLCGTTQADWAQAQNGTTPAKQTPVEKRLAFITKATKPVNDRALAQLAAKAVGQDIPDLTTTELTEVAEKMVEGQILGRTDRWKNACAWAAYEIGQAKKAGTLDNSFARWAVVQGSVWMCHAAD